MSTLLQIENLEISYGNQPVLTGAGFNVYTGQKLALVGRNGAGKSTLFKIITGNESPHAGEIRISSEAKIGYLNQHTNFPANQTVIEYLQNFSNREDWFCAKIASAFRLTQDHLSKPLTNLSGGYQMRAKLSAILSCEPNLLLLDEPTNYLDLATQLLLEHFLKRYRGAFILISHDREFIGRTCTETLELLAGKINYFPNTLEHYLEFRAKNLESTLKYNQKILEQKEHLQSFVDRFKTKASKASQARSRIKQIQKLQTIQISAPLKTVTIKISDTSKKSGTALHFDRASIGYPDKQIASQINLNIERGERVAVVGDNGQGKTTLLKTMSSELPLLEGKLKWSSSLKIGYYAQHTPARLNTDQTIENYLKSHAKPGTDSQQIYNLAGSFLFTMDDLKKSVSILSGGEKARLCLSGLLLQGCDVLILDEPTNHLDFDTVEALSTALSKTNLTLIFVSHDRSFVKGLATSVIEVKNNKVSRFLSPYSEYLEQLDHRLQAELADQESKTSSTTENEEKQQKELARRNSKRLKSKLSKLEQSISELEAEKQTLLNWFTENPSEYSLEKSQEFEIIEKRAKKLEAEWFNLSEQLESNHLN